MMEIKPIDDQNQVDNFLKAQNIPSGSFLQSYYWGEFQKQYGFKIWRLGIFDEGELKGIALIIKHPPLFGKSYLYCPKGPVLVGGERREARDGMFVLLFEKVREIAQAEDAIFFRLEPQVTPGQFFPLEQKLKLKKAPSVQPQITWVLDLKAPEEKILANMKQKTRYNIHLAEKRDVLVRTSTELKEIDRFFSLAQETAKRNKIKTHPKAYYYKMVETLSPARLLKFYIAEYKNKIIGMNLMFIFDKTITYLHGGSSDEFRNVMAPYLLHWQAIKDAKADGMVIYDFGGIAPENDPHHQWTGISRFKRGFGGYEVKSAGTFDKVFNASWYGLYRVFRKIRN